MKSFNKHILSTVAIGVLLVGCGGDGDGNSEVTSRGVAIDGILSGSTVCIDTNRDGVCSDESASNRSITDNDGIFEIISSSEGPLLLLGGTDLGTGLDFTGALKAPTGSTVITPLTSAVQALIDGGDDAKTAQTKVKSALGIPDTVDLVNFDPIASIGDKDTAVNAKIILEKQAQLQVLVHTVASAVAGVDDGTDINSTMSSVFEAIVANFNDDNVTIDNDMIERVVSKAADKVYEDNREAKVATKSSAMAVADKAVAKSEAAAKSIETATNDNAVVKLNSAIKDVNVGVQKDVETIAKDKASEIKKLSDTDFKKIEDALAKVDELSDKAEKAKEELSKATKDAEEAMKTAKTKAELEEATKAKLKAEKLGLDLTSLKVEEAKASESIGIKTELLEAKIAEAKAKNDEAKTSVKDATKLLENVENATDIEGVTEILTADKTKSIEALMAKVDTFDSNATSTMSSLSDLNISSIDELGAGYDLSGLSTESSGLIAEVKSLMSNMGSSAADIATAKEAMSSALTSLDEGKAEDQLTKAKDALSDLNIDKIELALKLAALKSQLSGDKTDSIEALMAKVDTFDSDANSTMSSLPDFIGESGFDISSLEGVGEDFNVSALGTDSDDLISKIGSLVGDMNTSASDIATAKEAMSSALTDLNVSEAKDQFEKAKVAFDDFSTNKTDLLGKVEELKSKVADVKGIEAVTRSFASLGSMDLQEDDIADKIAEAKTSLETAPKSNKDAQVGLALIGFAETLNDSCVGSILNYSDMNTTVNYDSVLPAMVASMASPSGFKMPALVDAPTGFATCTTEIVSNSAVKLKTLSDKIGDIFADDDNYMFSFDDENLTKPEATALRASLLLAASQLNYVAAHNLGVTDSMLTKVTETLTDGNSTVEVSFVPLIVDPVSTLLNNGDFFAYNGDTSQVKLDTAKADLRESVALMLDLNTSSLDIDEGIDLEKAKKIAQDISTNLADESGESNITITDENNNSITVDLRPLFKVEGGIDIYDFAKDGKFKYSCIYDVNSSKIHGYPTCSDTDEVYIEPVTALTASETNLDEVLLSMTIEGVSYSGDAMLSMFNSELDSAFRDLN